MAERDFDEALYVKSVPEIAFKDGMVHVCYVVGSRRFEFVMQPNIFLRTYRRAKLVADEFHGRNALAGIKNGH